VAMGFLFSLCTHLPELAPHPNARVRPRLRDDPRTDALETHGSFAALLEVRRGGVSPLSDRAPLAADTRANI